MAASALLAPSAAYAGEPRVAAIDWALFETVLALGVVPVAASELLQFRAIAVEPPVPESVVDLGLRGAPNYELLRIVTPDLILISDFYERQRTRLESIAPVLSLPVYTPGKPPYPIAAQAAMKLGERLGRRDAAMRYVAECHDEIERLREPLAALRQRPVFVISLGDARHFRAFGADSMPGDVIARLGFTNAWAEPTRYGATAPVGMEALARLPQAAIVVVGPLPPEMRRALPESALWKALPAVRDGRMAMLDPVNHFGGLPSARRFARLFAEAMLRQENAADD
jgi:ABC-type Fe3+-hydroxamate transport system substrate-binding protein